MAKAYDPTDPFGGLEGADRDVYTAILSTLRAYGLESLASTVFGYIQQGYSEQTISNLLPTTPAYKKRFAANDARIKAGLPALSPAEYLATEASYRSIMSAAGLPPGFYDQPSDFEKFIAQDVSPQEVNDRVQSAKALINDLPAEAKQAFRQWYTEGDMVAYALDRKRTTEVLDRQVRAAQAAGAASNSGLDINRGQAELIAQQGLSADQQAQGLQQVASQVTNVGRLSQMYGGDYTTDDAIAEVFQDSATARLERQGLNQREQGTFGGQANTSGTALSKRRAGQV